MGKLDNRCMSSQRILQAHKKSCSRNGGSYKTLYLRTRFVMNREPRNLVADPSSPELSLLSLIRFPLFILMKFTGRP
jgi:hypothetical protein